VEIPQELGHGWHNELCAAARLIEHHLRIRYHPEHVRKALKRRRGWASQKPRREARERDDEGVERWLDGGDRRIVREAWRRSAYVVFLGESGFLLTPTVRRTLAPRPGAGAGPPGQARPALGGQPPHGRPGGGPAEPVLPALVGQNPRRGRGGFLKGLCRQLGRLTVVWGRNRIHGQARAVRAWLAGHPEVAAEGLPGYVPALNPDEGAWGRAKYGRLASLVADSLGWLWE
jgi:hypothetical protein